jgi:hypothetical protein
MDELARAYATLGTSDAATLDQVRKRYKALVRKWHPDRFASDPQGQAEAAVRMRAINDAFRTVVAHRGNAGPAFGVPSGPAGATGAPPSWQSGRRLTREEIDRMVELMGNDGPLDWLMGDSWVEGLKEGFKESIERPVSRGRMATYIAAGAALIVPIWLELAGFGRADSGWLRLACAAGAFGLAMWLLPKE